MEGKLAGDLALDAAGPKGIPDAVNPGHDRLPGRLTPRGVLASAARTRRARPG
jgi:hypothetical protein